MRQGQEKQKTTIKYKKIFGQNFFLALNKILGPKKCLVQKSYGSIKMLGQKKIGSKKN